MRGIPKIFSKKRPVAPSDFSVRKKKDRRRRKENTVSPNQKKLATSTEPFKLGPSNKTGGMWAGTGYVVAIVIVATLILITALIMRSKF